MQLIKIENGIIVSHISSRYFIDGYIVVKDFSGRVGEPVSFYNKDWTRKSNIELYKEGLLEIPSGKKIVDDELVEMTDIEKMQTGIQEIPRGMKIENDMLVMMSEQEQLEAGLITRKDIYNREISDCKNYLYSTDWVVTKCTEQGISMQEKYPEILTKRIEARAKINELEEKIKKEENAGQSS